MDSTTRNQINKIARMAGLAFQNALRLHFDAIRLYKIPSFASALALSVLSMEELAKANALEDIAWHALIDNAPISDGWNISRKYFYDHKSKQMSFASRNLSPLVSMKVAVAVSESEESVRLQECREAYEKAMQNSADKKKIESLKRELEKAENCYENAYIKSLPASSLYRLAASGELEKVKQDALYVGVCGNKSPGELGARIQNPLATTSKRPEQYITFVNDFLLDLTVGELGGWHGVDAESIKQQLTKSLVYRLSRSWPKRCKVGKRALRLYTRIEIDKD